LGDVGLDADLTVARRGFYPVGGGAVTLTLRPSSVDPIDLTDCGVLRRVAVRSVASGDLADADVAERQATAAADALAVETPVDTEATYDETACPGSVVTLSAVYEGSRAGFSALGEPGKPSEEVAGDAVAAFERFHTGPAAVDRQLADQLQVPLALGGGCVAAPATTAHFERNREVIAAFGYDAVIERRDDRVLVTG
jgi:RNA 3'-terminal phosphate cyclase (ATP)